MVKQAYFTLGNRHIDVNFSLSKFSQSVDDTADVTEVVDRSVQPLAGVVNEVERVVHQLAILVVTVSRVTHLPRVRLRAQRSLQLIYAIATAESPRLDGNSRYAASNGPSHTHHLTPWTDTVRHGDIQTL